MGIPSYFSHIIKSFPNIIKSLYSLRSNNTKFHSMYMDCNSIIYDAFHLIDKLSDQPIVHNLDHDLDHNLSIGHSYNHNQVHCNQDHHTNITSFNNKVIDHVISNIENYITLIEPNKIIYIAFDGVAPFAKMKQQRTRRYKTSFMSKISFSQNLEHEPPKSGRNTAMITPGTDFMSLLSSRISHHFLHSELKYRVEKIIVSAADEPGEGEHKMFQYMRDNNSKSETVAVYGLDSDLIMLSIFHCLLFENIFIFREAPEFMKSSIPITPTQPNEPYFLDIGLLSGAILNEMQCTEPVLVQSSQCTAKCTAKCTEPVQCTVQTRIYDYIFLCFFLGNDFLPHFSALNIRTHGIQVLLDTYKKFIGNYPERSFITTTVNELGKVDRKINWRWAALFISELAKFEHQLILEEHVARDKFGKRVYPDTTPKDKENAFNNIPIIYRAEEQYIYPQEKFWEERYYKTLFQIDKKRDGDIRNLCLNYLEGLEWVFKYYTQRCPDWLWKYNYNYPPLLADLQRFVPHFETDFIKPNMNTPFLPKVQLAYVLPREQLYLLGLKNEQIMHDAYLHVYPQTVEFQWTFCRYFWEAHVKLPEISKTTLERWTQLLK